MGPLGEPQLCNEGGGLFLLSTGPRLHPSKLFQETNPPTISRENGHA